MRGTEAAREAGPVQETSMGMKDRKAFPKVTLSLTEPRTPQEGPIQAGLSVTGCLGGHEPWVTVPAWAQASCRPASSPPAVTTSPRSPCPFHISDEETQAGPYLAGHQHVWQLPVMAPEPPHTCEALFAQPEATLAPGSGPCGHCYCLSSRWEFHFLISRHK